ncbi:MULTISPECIES: antitoxin MazE family protein [Halomonadaceae]|uniref:antitoxin MazE family protein n=1 Tax=Halomonadaceae TaxID=28256 RepID=UPI0015979327|nr:MULTISPECIES: antitoxin MazE family protein [Halomonas]QJQ94072.1 antitoxin MazE family protein [Halomonas sp. PA5]
MARAVNERVKQRRDALRAQGLRPLQVWVPDTRSPDFARQCREQSRAVHDDSLENDTLEWIEEVADHEGWQ